PRLPTGVELFGPTGVSTVAEQALLPCTLTSFWIAQPALEHFLTRLRALLLERTRGRADAGKKELALYSALAQQCFINEYVFALEGDELRQATELRDILSGELAKAGDIPSLLVIAVAAYFPLHRVANVELLLNSDWPGEVDDLIRQQIREP